MKRKLSLIIRPAAVLLLAAVMLTVSVGCSGSAEVVAEGKVDNIRWILDDEGCLSFTGTGTLPGVEYVLSMETGLSETVRPDWYEHRGEVTAVNVGANIDGVSMNAFMGFPVLRTIDFSATVQHIDGYAVNGCPSLEKITIRCPRPELERFCIGYSGGTTEAVMEGVTIVGERGSQAESYAKTCGAKFSAL